mmetsp:Transcript_1200/g.2294  ORF Transcript_1200/g.2294 Transcript_1200/m.2294 type:complete len:365 (-) Transcript_1200:415-1509(-)
MGERGGIQGVGAGHRVVEEVYEPGHGEPAPVAAFHDGLQPRLEVGWARRPPPVEHPRGESKDHPRPVVGVVESPRWLARPLAFASGARGDGGHRLQQRLRQAAEVRRRTLRHGAGPEHAREPLEPARQSGRGAIRRDGQGLEEAEEGAPHRPRMGGLGRGGEQIGALGSQLRLEQLPRDGLASGVPLEGPREHRERALRRVERAQPRGAGAGLQRQPVERRHPGDHLGDEQGVSVDERRERRGRVRGELGVQQGPDGLAEADARAERPLALGVESAVPPLADVGRQARPGVSPALVVAVAGIVAAAAAALRPAAHADVQAEGRGGLGLGAGARGPVVGGLLGGVGGGQVVGAAARRVAGGVALA